jgi:hypothetical protein
MYETIAGDSGCWSRSRQFANELTLWCGFAAHDFL